MRPQRNRTHGRPHVPRLRHRLYRDGRQFRHHQKDRSHRSPILFLGVIISFAAGVIIAYAMGITDAESLTTIGAGACTFVVGPVTGTALGASSDIIAISIAAGVVKSILVTIGTPLIASYIGLKTPQSAMIFGGLMGTTSGTAAGLAATDPKLVPYGAMTATFYTGLGCLMCPSVLYFLMRALLD